MHQTAQKWHENYTKTTQKNNMQEKTHTKNNTNNKAKNQLQNRNLGLTKNAQGAQEPPERHLPTLSVGRHRQTGAGCARRSSDGPAPQSGPSTGEQRAHPARVGTHHEPRHSGRADQADPQTKEETNSPVVVIAADFFK